MKQRAIALFAVIAMISIIPAAVFALTPYQQDFELLNATDGAALENDGWLVFANVFAPDGVSWLYGYGTFTAPNNGGGFCQIAVDAGQYLNVFSDYANADHAAGNVIEANTFQELTVGAGDVGETWVFTFDAMKANLAGATTALAFIKTLDPNAGWATTNFITADMTGIPAAWGSYSLSITIDAGLVGQILQVGFSNSCSNYEGSGIFYDNVTFAPTGPVANEDASWGDVKALFR